MTAINPSDHILSLLGGKDNLVLMCNAYDFHQTPRELRFTIDRKGTPYRITLKASQSNLFDKMYDVSFTNLNTNTADTRNFVCDWWVPDLFTTKTGYHLSF